MYEHQKFNIMPEFYHLIGKQYRTKGCMFINTGITKYITFSHICKSN